MRQYDWLVGFAGNVMRLITISTFQIVITAVDFKDAYAGRVWLQLLLCGLPVGMSLLMVLLLRLLSGKLAYLLKMFAAGNDSAESQMLALIGGTLQPYHS